MRGPLSSTTSTMSAPESGSGMADYMINWNVGPLGLVLRADLGPDMPPVVAQVLPGESVASLAGVAVGDLLLAINGKKTTKLGYDKAMRQLYRHKLPIVLHFRMPQLPQQQPQQQPQAQQLKAQQQPTTVSVNGGSTRGPRALSLLSSASESREAKLRKQFSAVWEDGSLGFSFRPYAPGINIPTVDFIGAVRGQGKNMDQVCVNDVLIAINGDLTKEMGVERVLKLLHVLDKPVILRFHKSSQRIETPRLIAAPPPQVAVTTTQTTQTNSDSPTKKAEPASEEDLGVIHEGDEDDDPMAVASDRLADQIQLRSESRRRERSSSTPVSSPLPPPPPSQPVAVVEDEEDRDDERPEQATPPRQLHRTVRANSSGSARRVPAVASEFAARMVPHAGDSELPLSPPPPPAQRTTRTPVPITIADSYANPKSTTSASSFHIPIEHARAIVARSSGKTVEECEFGGVPLLAIREGSVQAKLLVTFAKACLVKQMREDQEQQQQQTPDSEDHHEHQSQNTAAEMGLPYRHEFSTPSSSMRVEPETSSYTWDRRRDLNSSFQSYRSFSNTPSSTRGRIERSATFEGNTLAPGRPKYLTYSFHQSRGHHQTYDNASSYRTPPSSAGRRSGELGRELERNFRRRLAATEMSSRGTVLSSARTYHDQPMNGTIIKTAPPVAFDDTVHRMQMVAMAGLQRQDTATSNTNVSSLYSISPAAPTPLAPVLSPTGGSEPNCLTLSQLRVSEETNGMVQNGNQVEILHLGDSIKSVDELRTTRTNRSPLASPHLTEMIALDGTMSSHPAAASASTQSPASTPSPGLPVGMSPGHSEPDHEDTVEWKDEDPAMLTMKTSPPSPSAPVHQETEVELNIPDHPVVHQLCSAARDLEPVLSGNTVKMILLKKQVVEEIQDILSSLEMELQFERHSHIGFGRKSVPASPGLPASTPRSCVQCGKRGELADLAMDGRKRGLFCQDCWELYFFSERSSSSQPQPTNDSGAQPTTPAAVAPESHSHSLSSSPDLDPFEYSLHDSEVNVAGDFEDWQQTSSDSDAFSERDSNVTITSSITDHADEVWL